MNKQLIARHFINNEASLIEFQEQPKKTFLALELLKKYNLNFCLVRDLMAEGILSQNE